jgi:thiol-disulfide isomerase/thioredoxin
MICIARLWTIGTVTCLTAVLLTSSVLSSSSVASQSDNPPRLIGHSGQYTLLTPVRTARLTPFSTANGDTIDLRRFRGKVILLNFWATWCAPCGYEMPSLDRLAAQMSGEDFVVLPIALDTATTPIASFYRDLGLDHLGIYFDPKRRTAYIDADNPDHAEFALYGLPISYIIDREGRARGYIVGAVDWQSGAAKSLVRYYITAN